MKHTETYDVVIVGAGPAGANTAISYKKLNPGIILEKSITPTELRIKQLEDYKANKSITTSIDEEGGLIRDNLDIFLKSRFSEKTISLTDKIFCWGQYDFEALLRIFPEHKKKFTITGNPRINLWNKTVHKKTRPYAQKQLWS